MEVLTIKELCKKIPVAESTIRRWLSESRRGIGSFPLPISSGGRKLLWTQASIEQWLNCERTPNKPVIPDVVNARRKREEANFAKRQSNAKQILEHHAAGRSAKVK